MHRSRVDPSMAWGLSAMPAVHSLPQGPQEPQASRTMVAGNFRFCRIIVLSVAILDLASIETLSRLPRLLLENSLHDAGPDAELLADFEDAIPAGPQL